MAAKYAKDQPAGFTNKIERVAIVGATGSVGKYMVQELLKTGKHTVTALTRSAKSGLPSGLKVSEVDYDNEDTLVKALEGQQFFIISLSVMVPKDTQGKLIAAAAKAGVPWVMPNSYSPDFMDKAFAQENMTGPGIWAGINDIEERGVSSWVSLTCGFWYEFSLAVDPAWFGFDFANKKVIFYDDGKQRISISTWVQCGRAVAQLLSLKELPEDENDTSPTISQWRNKPLYTASFVLSQREMLESANRVLGLTEADWEIEYEATDARYKRGLEILKAGNRKGYGIAMYARTFYPSGEGNTKERYGLANEALGLPEEDLDEATKRAIVLAQRGVGNESYKYDSTK